MQVLRTPDERFKGLTGYPYEPRYYTLSEHHDMRMHYVDEGPKAGRVVLMLHGEPSWSYLYRHMIPIIAEAGYRAVAPDLIGFGRSDKPAQRTDYSYSSHMDWLRAFVHGMDLQRIVLVCQDWGGLLGLRLVAEEPERFAAVVATNTFLPTGREPVGEAFLKWRSYSQEVEEMPISKIVDRGTQTALSPSVLAAYDAPFPDESFKEGARQFPMLVPIDGEDPEAVINQKCWGKLAEFDKPFVTAFADQDPITRGGDKLLGAVIKGARDAPHTTIEGAGHFVQEDRGPELARVVLNLAGSL
jgi:haloalkane dehalogenase